MRGTQEQEGYSLTAVLKRMLNQVRQQNPRLFVLFGLYTPAAAVCPVLAVLLPKWILGELEKGAGARPVQLLLIVLAYFTAAGVLGFSKTWIYNWSYNKICLLRLNYVRDCSVKVMEMAYPHTEDAGFMQTWEKAFSAASGNDNGVEGIYHKLFETPAVGGTILILAGMIGRLSPWILLGLILDLAALLWINRQSYRYRYSRKKEEAGWKRRIQYYGNMTCDFSYGKDIRMYGMRQRILDNYSGQIEGYKTVQKSIAKREYRLGFLGLAALLVSDGLTYGILIARTVGGMSIADFSMYLTATVTLSVCLKELADQLSFIRGEGQYVHELYRFLDEDMGERGGDWPAVENDTLEVVFDDVSFRYPGSDRYVFRHLNLTIHKGERLAVVGLNGAGKTTLVKLMMGLFDVTEGQIRINGVPIQKYNKKALYSMFAAVFQEVGLMAFTVRENVAGRLEGIDDRRVEQVLRQVGLWEKIDGLPGKTRQMLLKIMEEDGAILSGGEVQKLLIARALYKDANMVVMDEPTAALDALAEAEIYEDFSHLVKGKTAVYISHRLASTRFCDHIALFDREGLKEYGTHEELMALRGSYYEMFMVQGKYYTEPPESMREAER